MIMFGEIMFWIVVAWFTLGAPALFLIMYLDPFWRPSTWGAWFAELMVWPFSLYSILRYGP